MGIRKNGGFYTELRVLLTRHFAKESNSSGLARMLTLLSCDCSELVH